MDTDGRALGAGALAGLVATGTMSAAMLVGQRLGLLGESPPHRIADAALGVRGHRRGRGGAALRNGLMATGHFGFGAALGAALAALHRRVPAPLGPIPRGLLAASLVWFVSYQGWVPALGLLPPVHRDRPGRPVTMLIAHWVYGATLGACLGRAGRQAFVRLRD